MSEYEDVLYDDYAFVEAHPARLRAMAALFGLRHRPGPLRVLDVGCGLGGHLMPLAEQDPQGTYVGLDLSAPQIAQGRETVAKLGLQNVDLRVGDICDPPPDLGRFDVIVCHGVYSWIPEAAQAALWPLLHDHLAPNGLAYVSYNTWPGWRHRGTLREVLTRLVPPAGAATDRERIAAAREVLTVWASTLDGRASHRLAALGEEIALLDATTDAYLLYEHLAAINEPCWFTDVAEAAAGAGLRYLGDAMISSMFPSLTPETEAWIAKRAPTFEATEQAKDLLTHRLFRRSVFVHHHTVIDRQLHWRSLEGLWMAARLWEKEDAPGTFINALETEVEVTDEAVRSAIEALIAASPGALCFEAICRASLGEDAPTPARRDLGSALLQLITQGMLELRTDFPPIATSLPEHPFATALARLQAERDEPGAVNLRHERVKLGTTDKAVLRVLDGTRDRRALLEHLSHEATHGAVEIRIDDVVRRDPESIEAALDVVLDRLRRASFLVDTLRA